VRGLGRVETETHVIAGSLAQASADIDGCR
jgi:hypothetical protein